MSRETAILCTLVVYKICLIAIGLYYRRKTHDAVDFYLGGRKLGPLVSAISASASSSSAWTLLGVSGAAYLWGISAIWLFPSCVGGFILNWYVLAPALRKTSHQTGAITVTEVLAGKTNSVFRSSISKVASVIILVSLGTYVSSQFQGAGKAFSETFNVSLTASILIGGAIVVFYTLLGGFWAVSVTDTLQGLLMGLTALVLPIASLSAVGGLEGLVQGLMQVPDSGFLSPIRDFAPVAGVGFILGLLGIGLGYPGQPHVVNRFMALEDGVSALKIARRIAVAWAMIVYSGMLLLGLAGRVLVPNLDDPEVVFITLTNQLFHPVVAGIMIAAVLSAIMSTADSQLLVASSSVSHDLGFVRHSRLSQLTLSRMVVLVLSAGAILGAIYGSREIFSQVLFAWAAMGCAFGPVLLIQVMSNGISGRARLICILLGFTLSVIPFYSFPASFAWKGALERFFPFLLVLVIGILVLKSKKK
jgi:sodium/proline symporter